MLRKTVVVVRVPIFNFRLQLITIYTLTWFLRLQTLQLGNSFTLDWLNISVSPFLVVFINLINWTKSSILFPCVNLLLDFVARLCLSWIPMIKPKFDIAIFFQHVHWCHSHAYLFLIFAKPVWEHNWFCWYVSQLNFFIQLLLSWRLCCSFQFHCFPSWLVNSLTWWFASTIFFCMPQWWCFEFLSLPCSNSRDQYGPPSPCFPVSICSRSKRFDDEN